MKNLLVLTFFIWSSYSILAQVPGKMSYQMVVRNSDNSLVANQAVGVKISLLQGSATGAAVYVETHTPPTNINGLASFIIGNGTVLSGSMANVNWAVGLFFIKTELDVTGGNNYSITSTTQLLVYRMHFMRPVHRAKVGLICICKAI
jgi:hypothetical protein